ncbi:MAG: 5-formyltetrahydrofolate cyclo-ligase [Muribaculaceae bacterium]|nr:5-formyltetrahydrofolate cyclo-ligase [Muribaculaceae bacterium]
MNKAEIRRRVSNHKALLADTDRQVAADAVFDRLEKMAAFVMADKILMYNSLPDELSTRSFIDKWAARKHFFLPRVNGVDLDVLPYDRAHMHLGAFRIEEPDGDDTVDVDTLDLIIVPAVAYDSKGNRVGRGKGYYDRLLARARAVTIGVAYDFQLFDTVEVEPHDRPVDIVITPSGIYFNR